MHHNNSNTDIFSKRVKAGKRVYFFDVKSTRSEDYYVTVTESKRSFEDQNKFIKHKIFLYKEDFEKFSEGLEAVIKYVKDNQEVTEKRYIPENNENYRGGSRGGSRGDYRGGDAKKKEENPSQKPSDDILNDIKLEID